MKRSTAFNHQKRLLEIIDDLFLRLKVYKLPLSTIPETYREKVKGDPIWDKLPVRTKDYVFAYLHGRQVQFRKSEITWVMFWEGEYYESFTSLPEEAQEAYGAPYGDPIRLEGHFAYISDKTKRWN